MTQLNRFDPPWAPVRLRSAVYVEKDQQVLLVYDPVYRGGCWTLPGGGVDFEETALQAAEREVLEETGITIKVTGIWGLREIWEKENDFPNNNTFRKTMELIFVGDYITGDANHENDPSRKPDGRPRVKKCKWIALEGLGSFINGVPIYPAKLFSSPKPTKINSVLVETIMLPPLDLRGN
jgi:8-oxo-dGTP pyrophosphatase MutT (NUDIX family)